MRLHAILFVLLFTMIVLNSCGVAETVMTAGMWWGFFVLAFIVIIALLFVSRTRK